MMRKYEFVLIDDDPDESEIFKAALGQLSHSTFVKSFTSWKAAYEYLTQTSDYRPDFLILDVVLNGIMYYFYLSSIKELSNLSDTKVVIYSTIPNSPFFEHELARLNCSFLLKGPSTKQLEEDISRLIAESV